MAKDKLRKLEKKYEKQQAKAERTQTKLVRAREQVSADSRISNAAPSQ